MVRVIRVSVVYRQGNVVSRAGGQEQTLPQTRAGRKVTSSTSRDFSFRLRRRQEGLQELVALGPRRTCFSSGPRINLFIFCKCNNIYLFIFSFFSQLYYTLNDYIIFRLHSKIIFIIIINIRALALLFYSFLKSIN